jgi:hypothetical protein
MRNRAQTVGGCDRPHEGDAQAWRELQRSHLAARRIEDKRPKITCTGRLNAHVCELERDRLGRAEDGAASLL